MGSLSKDVQKRLQSLSEDFIRQLPLRFREIDDEYQLLQTDPSEEQLFSFRLQIHKLAGSGATFGISGLSETARELELVLDTLIQAKNGLVESDFSTIKGYLTELSRLCGVEEEADELEPIDEVEAAPISRDADPLEGLPENRGRPIVHLVDNEGDLSDTVGEQLSYYGYDVETLTEIDDIRGPLDSGQQRLLIVNCEHLTLRKELGDRLLGMKKRYDAALGLIFVSPVDSFEMRLLSVRAGGDAFFLFPLDIGRLVDRIDDLVSRSDAKPYHVLIIDDDQEQVAYYAFVLQQAGMVTSVASDPMKILSVLVEAKPEIILMDMYMPGCNGIELVSLLRQHDAFLGIPIIFLSFESNRDKQIAAICKGGDDFLTKPIQPDYLIQMVTTRAERNRHVRYFMERDALTGLLNHTKLKEQLGRELLRYSRTGQTICFAMIDADHFKRVNDSYGHLAGDRVLKNLARLLQDRLRRTDIIGRYGGEEFGVVLMNTDLKNARKIMDEIRDSFSKLMQQAGDERFYVTFSCGIASCPDYLETELMTAAADRALYTAKENGRNQVRTASFSEGEEKLS